MITQVWTQKQDVPGGVRHHPFFFSADTTVYFGGGHRETWFEWDLNKQELNPIDNLPGSRVAGTQFQHGGYGYLLAGDNTFHDHLPEDLTFMRYDPKNGDWTYLPQLPDGSRWAPSSFIIDDILYFFDGVDYDSPGDASIWKFDLSALACLPALDLTANTANEGEANIFWMQNTSADGDTLLWRKVGEDTWNVIADASPIVNLTDLEVCQTYEYQIITSCDTIRNESPIQSFRTQGCGPCIDQEYCQSLEFLSDTDVFIEKVGFNDYENVSGNSTDGYEDFTVPDPEEIFVGEEMTLTVQVNEEIDGNTIGVWIDIDQDGDFDRSEQVVNTRMSGTELITGVEIPADAPIGRSRIRVVYGAAIGASVRVAACTSSRDYIGETEDYCIQLAERPTNVNELDKTLALECVP